ncbi:16S rRNA (adenine(1518)-N(6)/adenine(1519)-N(6))-dimethyltransferase RsmA [Caldisalinibacter kiritimatiensis]|uniref:Ribosomal RNA small subunit methyltransferase A n=1 Tax=Caldisalinibacter kiritimatiensis TaxID=1304284 RepID=R1AUF0_9FIRM|nr:16S rRNA (adenine(1518)-N(6)/adenine(1519)-N(6))-dimethyltransferase RsmA [Caldisalinibacter kiritimatiensis]EOD00282.1 Dimethyladenosine transferase [Caldisalinibacter kiritimatiensis]
MDKRLYSPKATKEIIEKYGFKFSKSFGQNFLIDKNILDKICEGANITKEDGVIEIGPGIGTLTQELCERAGKVVAVELDNRLIPILDETLFSYDNVKVIQGDILKIDIEDLIKTEFDNKKVKVVANLPYYITTPIIMKLLEERYNIEKIVVMIQKEVAMRIQAAPGGKDYGALSIAAQYYSNPQIIANVPKNVFIPKPKVDSAVIMLDVYSKPKFNVKDEKLLFKVVKAAFSKRRKTLVNALSSGGLGLEKDQIREILSKHDIDHRIRGEKLSIEDFIKISDAIYSIQ